MIYTHKVQYYETDAMKIVHHSNYIRWLEEARVYFLKQVGAPLTELEKNGIVIPVIDVSCRYIDMMHFEETAKITAVLEEFKGIRMYVSYTIEDGDRLCCTAKSTHCFLHDGKIVNLKRKFPQFYEKIASQIGVDSEIVRQKTEKQKS